MTLASQITALATAVGSDINTIWTLLNGKASDLAALSTSDKTNLVAALNEVKAAVDAIDPGDIINDGTTATGTTWSSTKISNQITAAIDALVGSAPGALDTLQELADALNDDASVIDTILAAQSKRLRFDAAQTLDAAQQLQGCNNLGVGDPTTDFSGSYTAARDA